MRPSNPCVHSPSSPALAVCTPNSRTSSRPQPERRARASRKLRHPRAWTDPDDPRRLRHPRLAKLSHRRSKVRAWTIHKASAAPQAAGVIHTDFERGFIAAQIVNYHELIAAGSKPLRVPPAKSAPREKTTSCSPMTSSNFDSMYPNKTRPFPESISQGSRLLHDTRVA